MNWGPTATQVHDKVTGAVISKPSRMSKLISPVIYPIVQKIRGKDSCQLLKALSHLLEKQGITLIDIGAAGGAEPRWENIKQYLNYIGFEPDERSKSILADKATFYREHTLFDCAVEETNGSIPINLCRKPQLSSVYLPNQSLVKLFPDAERFDVLQTKSVKTRRLDDFQFEAADFIKLDTQGNELNILKGGVATLRKTLGIQIEVEFLPVYNAQPLFGDVIVFLADHGFEFIDFISLNRWERDAFNGLGQCMIGDALFLRTPEKFLEQCPVKKSVSSYLAILLLYRRFDLIDKTLLVLSADLRREYKAFSDAIIPIRKSHYFNFRITKFLDYFLSVVKSDYHNHLMY